MNKTANKIIDTLGGTAAVAALCEIKPPSVCRWRIVGIPSARQQFLQAVVAVFPLSAGKLRQLGLSAKRIQFLKGSYPALFGQPRKRRKAVTKR